MIIGNIIPDQTAQMIPYGEISQTSIKCTLLRGFELELRLSLAKIPYLGELTPGGLQIILAVAMAS
jgi:hypothetical protein